VDIVAGISKQRKESSDNAVLLIRELKQVLSLVEHVSQQGNMKTFMIDECLV
jgi:hypothetical protein